MRLQEFANYEDQISLWKLISDSVWNGIKQQAIEQEQKRLASQKKPSKKKSKPTTSKKPKTVSSTKQAKTATKKQDSVKSTQASQQTQKPQVLPKVFTSTATSNLVKPQTPVNSVASSNEISAQNAALPQSVAQTQRQLYPLANDENVKRLTY